MFNNLCGPCLRIIEKIQVPAWHRSLAHQPSLEALKDSVEAQCGICTVLLEYFQNSEIEKYADVFSPFPTSCLSDTCSATWQSSVEIVFSFGNVEELNLKITFEAITPDTPDLFVGHHPAPHTNSPSTWTLVDRWLKTCKASHARCNARSLQPWAPTRLIDLGTPDNKYIRLVEQDRYAISNEPYATLSHCWGFQIPLIARKSNMLDLMKNISPHDLSKTFNDAIGITRRFGLRYIWIDSLCILQDSVEDWKNQSELMSKVYRYAEINIGATGAHNGTEGCFWSRNPGSVYATIVPIHWRKEDQARKYLLVPDDRVWAQRLLNEPLNMRAWVLQERILSPRMIHFGRHQIYWECRESTACETYPTGLPPSLLENTLVDIKTLNLGDEPKDTRWPAKHVSGVEVSRNVIWKLWKAFTQLFRPTEIYEMTVQSATKSPLTYRDWDAIVELYSRSELTKEGDKLVALAGIASVIASRQENPREDCYLAGLWQSSLPSHLLWISEKTRNRSPSRYKSYVTPSWSWACLRGQISFGWCQHDYHPKDFLVVLREAKVESDGVVGFGQITGGYLHMSGPLASCLWTSHVDAPLSYPRAGFISSLSPQGSEDHAYVRILRDPEELHIEAEISFDTETDALPDVLTLLPVIRLNKRTETQKESVMGLALRQHFGTTAYERVGFFYTTASQACYILRNLPQKEIRII